MYVLNEQCTKFKISLEWVVKSQLEKDPNQLNSFT